MSDEQSTLWGTDLPLTVSYVEDEASGGKQTHVVISSTGGMETPKDAFGEVREGNDCGSARLTVCV